MSLPSQTGRSGGFRTARFSVSRPHRKSPLRKAAPVLIIAAVAVAAFVLWPFDNTPKTTNAATSDDPTTTTQPGTAAPQQARTTPAPITRRIPSATDTPTTTTTTNNNNNTPASLSMGETPRDETQRPTLNPEPSPRTEPTTIPTPTDITPTTNSPAAALIAEANGALQDGRIFTAREILNRALHHPRASRTERAAARDQLSQIAREVTFTPRFFEQDPMTRRYTVQPGDSLSKIAQREGVNTDWRFIARINNITNPASIRVGQTLKIVQGPFHAEIHKSSYRFDLFSNERDSQGNPIFLASFPVGLGEYDSTPTGNWTVKNREANPAWVNPRDSTERYSRNDPENPIGEHWIGLEGNDPSNQDEWGIGIHGTIEPETIGSQASMGCVRMLQDDVALAYETLMPERSTVVIRD